MVSILLCLLAFLVLVFALTLFVVLGYANHQQVDYFDQIIEAKIASLRQSE